MAELVNGIPLYDIVGMLSVLAFVALALLWRAGREPDTRSSTTSARNPQRKASRLTTTLEVTATGPAKSPFIKWGPSARNPQRGARWGR